MAIFTHVSVGTNDLAKAVTFYDAVFAALDLTKIGEASEKSAKYGSADGPEFIVCTPANGEPATFANGGTIGLKAASPAAVDAFHAAAMANGATDEGAPGPRPYIPNAYGAYVRDPDGNKLCAYTFVAAE